MTVICYIGWHGIGYDGGLFPELRLGVVTLSWCRGHWRERLRAAALAMRGAM